MSFCCWNHSRSEGDDDDEADQYGYNDEAVVVADPQLSMDNFVSDIFHLCEKEEKK